MKKAWKIVGLICILAILVSCAVPEVTLPESVAQSPAVVPASERPTPDPPAERPTPLPSVEPEESAPCTVEMLDVGQGLSVLIGVDGEYLLYDGGGRETSSYVVSVLRERGITNLRYMVASHYDEDHISGLVGVLATCQVDEAITPDYEVDTKIYQSFQTGLAESGAEVLHPQVGDSFSLGSGSFQILSPNSWDYPDENDRSVAIRLTYGKFSCVLTGDAQTAAEADMVSSGLPLSATIYVAGHHGSSSSSSLPFLKRVSPNYGFISCGADNAYGHPAQQTMDALHGIGAEIFRTDKQGAVTAYTDGETLWFSQDPCGDWSAGGTAAAPDGEAGYVLNVKSMKFHRPDCDSVSQMNPANRIDTAESRESLIRQGYSPCGSCKP